MYIYIYIQINIYAHTPTHIYTYSLSKVPVLPEPWARLGHIRDIPGHDPLSSGTSRARPGDPMCWPKSRKITQTRPKFKILANCSKLPSMIQNRLHFSLQLFSIWQTCPKLVQSYPNLQKKLTHTCPNLSAFRVAAAGSSRPGRVYIYIYIIIHIYIYNRRL